MSDGVFEIECSKVRVCKWKGKWKDLKSVPDKKESKKHGMKISKDICPKCGNKYFYEIK